MNDTLRLPFRQRLAIVLNEFGTALAGRGDDLNEAIHRANPALRDTDRVLAMLAGQNRTLAQLAVDSDRVLAPLAARRKRVSDFVVQANTTAQATAERSDALMRTFERFPTFLRQLRPTLTDLGALSDEMTPVLIDLGRAAPSLNQFVLELGPFSSAATPALRSLARATDVGGPALQRSRPLIRQLADFSGSTGEAGVDLARPDHPPSLDKSGGIERIMDYIFFQATAVNGFDGISHYLRAELLTNLCSQYGDGGARLQLELHGHAIRLGAPSNAKPNPRSRSSAALRANMATIGTGKAAPASGGRRAAAPSGPDPFRALQELVDPATSRLRQGGLNRVRQGVRNGSPAYGHRNATDAALNYLLGNSP